MTKSRVFYGKLCHLSPIALPNYHLITLLMRHADHSGSDLITYSCVTQIIRTQTPLFVGFGTFEVSIGPE
ncbi:hypothetical protein, partial [Paenibacillus odorifer]|uniref:hypothetical protein n=1 Tax=Paenibacillus odorifer TaxID=189426 RepID=UPI001C37D78B